MQASYIYLTIAGIGGILFVIGLVRFVRTHFSPSQSGAVEEPAADKARVPFAALQKRAWWGLAIVVLTVVAIAAVFLTNTDSSYNEDRGQRAWVLAIALAGALAYVVVVMLTRVKKGPDEVLLDERDKEILSKAPAFQLIAVLVSLGLWVVVLTEAYWESGLLPVSYLSLIFWSVLAVNMLSWSIGVLLAYRRM